jgi:hypothetical protein
MWTHTKMDIYIYICLLHIHFMLSSECVSHERVQTLFDVLWSDKENNITRGKNFISLCMSQNVRCYGSLKIHYIISRTAATIWSKVTLGLLPTITLEVAPFSALFPAHLQFFKCTLEVVFYEGVQHRL